MKLTGPVGARDVIQVEPLPLWRIGYEDDGRVIVRLLVIVHNGSIQRCCIQTEEYFQWSICADSKRTIAGVSSTETNGLHVTTNAVEADSNLIVTGSDSIKCEHTVAIDIRDGNQQLGTERFRPQVDSNGIGPKREWAR